MNKYFAIAVFAVIVLFVCVSALNSQTLSEPSCDTDEVTAINKIVNEIYNAVPSINPLKTDVKENEILYAYYKEGNILEIEIIINSSAKKQKQEYYFDKGFLILVIGKNYDVNDNEMKEPAELMHYYFKDDKMICWLKGDLSAAPRDDTYSSMEKIWLDNTDRYLLMIQ